MPISTTDLLIMIGCALGAGLGLTTLGVLIELHLRKKHPAPLEEAAVQEAAAPPSAPPQLQPAAPSPPVPSAAPLPELGQPPASPAAAPAPPAQLPQPAPPPARVAITTPPAVSPPPVEIPPAPAPAPPPPVEVAKPAVSRLRLGLRKTRDSFMNRLRGVMGSGANLEEIYEGLEEALIAADVGVEASTRLVEAVRKRLTGKATPDAIRDALKEEIAALLQKVERRPADPGDAPLVIMLVGVNGVGKTTTVAKLAAMLKEERGAVLVAAADTFRAAAIEQLEIWCQRVGVDIIKQKAGSDPAAVAFDAVKAAKARKTPAVLIDTAGRLQTKVNLMEELKKIARVVGREVSGAPHETWLVLDANTGQNALSQARIFADAVPLSGVVLAKLDSTAKGGVIVAIADRLKLPVRFVGVGEDLADLRPFDGREFAEELFAADDGSGQAGKSYAA